uniref:Uncharacterized protein n=1 Tax=Mustela putorius furo TaxID=9669 RepID=M3XQG7_MUSPF
MFRLYSRSLTQGNAAVTADYTTQRSPRAGAPDSPQDPGLPFPACCFPRSRLPPSRGALHRPLHVLPPAHPARGKSPLGQKLQVSWLPMSALSRSWVSGVQRGSRLPAEKQCIRWGPPNQAARVYAWTRITFRGTPSSQEHRYGGPSTSVWLRQEPGVSGRQEMSLLPLPVTTGDEESLTHRCAWQCSRGEGLQRGWEAFPSAF